MSRFKVGYCLPILLAQTLEEDVEGYVSVVEGLGKEAKRLVSANHFDAANITARQVTLFYVITK